MKKLLILGVFMICSANIYAQELNQIGPHGGEVIPLNDFQIEMVKDCFKCLVHPKVIGKKDDICSKCEGVLEREKKIEFYLLDKNFNELVNTSNIAGRVRIVFKDETASSKKIRISNSVIWVSLGNHGYRNYQQAILTLKFNNKKYKVTFGDPLGHKGHHH